MTSDSDFDFGLIDIDTKCEQIPKESAICDLAYQHVFEKKLLAQHYYLECKKCGYSPDLDFNKPKFKECHEEYLAWKKTLEKK